MPTHRKHVGLDVFEVLQDVQQRQEVIGPLQRCACKLNTRQQTGANMRHKLYEVDHKCVAMHSRKKQQKPRSGQLSGALVQSTFL